MRADEFGSVVCEQLRGPTVVLDHARKGLHHAGAGQGEIDFDAQQLAVESSTTFRVRNHRPFVSTSLLNSSDQQPLAATSTTKGCLTRASTHSLRSRGKFRASARQMRNVHLWWITSLFLRKRWCNFQKSQPGCRPVNTGRAACTGSLVRPLYLPGGSCHGTDAWLPIGESVVKWSG
jgi:hypothetical protein